MSDVLYQILVSLSQTRPAGLPEIFNVQALPEGRFQARDGRPGNIKGSKTDHFVLDRPTGLAIVKNIKARASAMVIDYEHQSEHSRKNGEPAPAAGWINDAIYIDGSGLWLAVDWTQKAKAMIDADEYRYISPTMLFNLNSGKITELFNLALTNNPALDGLSKVTASFQLQITDNEEKPMEELLKQLRALLGLAEDADQAAITAAIKALVEKGKTEQGNKQDFSVDLSKYAPMEALTTLQSANAQLQQQLATLQAQVNTSQMDEQIKAALSDGRLLPAMKGWAEKLGQENPEALSAYLKAAVPAAPPGGKQTSGLPTDQGKASLSDEDRYVLEQLGISEEAYLSSKKQEIK